jgi:RNA polymerase sigma-70 factor (TIGR02943 family)
MSFSQKEAEDLVQDVLATFLETLDRFEGRSQLRTWLFGILHNKVRERRRQHYQDQKNDPIDEVFESRFDARGTWIRPPKDPDQAVTSEEISTALNGCLEGLPAAQREVFVMREMEDLETPEICKILGITVTNMSVLMHRARIRLRECMEGRGWRNAP